MTPVKEDRQRVAEELRKAIYREIRQVLDRSPVRLSRAMVVQVLATMTSEQAAIVAGDEHNGND